MQVFELSGHEELGLNSKLRFKWSRKTYETEYRLVINVLSETVLATAPLTRPHPARHAVSINRVAAGRSTTNFEMSYPARSKKNSGGNSTLIILLAVFVIGAVFVYNTRKAPVPEASLQTPTTSRRSATEKSTSSEQAVHAERSVKAPKDIGKAPSDKPSKLYAIIEEKDRDCTAYTRYSDRDPIAALLGWDQADCVVISEGLLFYADGTEAQASKSPPASF